MDSGKQRSRVQEQLVHFYLRLNGFFVTHFIAHSPTWGNNRAEFDVLAIRHPNSIEPEREIGTDGALDLGSAQIEILLGEVKTRGNVTFNPSLQSPEAVQSALNWIGALPKADVLPVAEVISAAIRSGTPVNPIAVVRTGVRVRCVLICGDCEKNTGAQPWFLSGGQMLAYARACLCPETRRAGCSTAYDYSAWGEFEGLVRFVKSTKKVEDATASNLYSFLGLADK